MGNPQEAYAESIASCLEGKSCVPQWYAAVSGGRIVGGLGVIENDFHDRKDLTPNVCAVYVEEAYRCRGVAGGRCIFSPTIPPYTRDMAGNFCAWHRGMGSLPCPGCMYIKRTQRG